MQGGFSYDQYSNQQGADPSLRLGDLTPRKPHYQTGPATRQPSAKSTLIATINRNGALRMPEILFKREAPMTQGLPCNVAIIGCRRAQAAGVRPRKILTAVASRSFAIRLLDFHFSQLVLRHLRSLGGNVTHLTLKKARAKSCGLARRFDLLR
jgi:hypothetical protein